MNRTKPGLQLVGYVKTLAVLINDFFPTSSYKKDQTKISLLGCIYPN